MDNIFTKHWFYEKDGRFKNHKGTDAQIITEVLGDIAFWSADLECWDFDEISEDESILGLLTLDRNDIKKMLIEARKEWGQK